jgi:hypothetical protein
MIRFKQYINESKEQDEYRAQVDLSNILDTYDKDSDVSKDGRHFEIPSITIWDTDKWDRDKNSNPPLKKYYKWDTWDDGIHAIASSMAGHYHIHGMLDNHFGGEVKNMENFNNKINDTFGEDVGRFRDYYGRHVHRLSNLPNIKPHVDRLLSYSNPSGFKDEESRANEIRSWGRMIFDDKFTKAREFHIHELVDHISRSDPNSVRTHLINLNKSKTEKFNHKLGLVFHGGTEINNRSFRPTHEVDVKTHINGMSIHSPRVIFQKKTEAQLEKEMAEASHFIHSKLYTKNLEDGLAAVAHPKFGRDNSPGGSDHITHALGSPHLEVQRAAVQHPKFGRTNNIIDALYSPHLEIQRVAVNAINKDFYKDYPNSDVIKTGLKSKFPEIRNLTQEIINKPPSMEKK